MIDYGEPLSAEEIRDNNPTIDTLDEARAEQWRRNRTKGKGIEGGFYFLLLFLGVLALVLLL